MLTSSPLTSLSTFRPTAAALAGSEVPTCAEHPKPVSYYKSWCLGFDNWLVRVEGEVIDRNNNSTTLWSWKYISMIYHCEDQSCSRLWSLRQCWWWPDWPPAVWQPADSESSPPGPAWSAPVSPPPGPHCSCTASQLRLNRRPTQSQSPHCHKDPQERGITIDDDTGVSWWSLD